VFYDFAADNLPWCREGRAADGVRAINTKFARTWAPNTRSQARKCTHRRVQRMFRAEITTAELLRGEKFSKILSIRKDKTETCNLFHLEFLLLLQIKLKGENVLWVVAK
jgi:hypothetical protein